MSNHPTLYSHTNFDFFYEAIGNGITDEQEKQVTEMLENREFEKLGRFLWNLAVEYEERLNKDYHDFYRTPHDERSAI